MKKFYATIIAVFLALSASAQTTIASENFENAGTYADFYKNNAQQWKESITPASTTGDTRHIITNGGSPNLLGMRFIDTRGYQVSKVTWLQWRGVGSSNTQVLLNKFTYTINDAGTTITGNITELVYHTLDGTPIAANSQPTGVWYQVTATLPSILNNRADISLDWEITRPSGNTNDDSRQFRFDNVVVLGFKPTVTFTKAALPITSLALNSRINTVSYESYTVSGTDLTSTVVLSVPEPFRISLSNDPATFTLGKTITLSPDPATAKITGVVIHVRYMGAESPGSTTNNIEHKINISTPIISNLSVTGTTLTPTLTFSHEEQPLALNTLFIGVMKLTEEGYEVYTLEGSNLVSKVTISVDVDGFFELAITDTETESTAYDYKSSVEVFPAADGSLSRRIFVKYKGSDVSGNVLEEILHVSTAINKVLNVEGSTSDEELSPQPVELSSFTGQVKNGLTKLAWTTASETNNEKFLVERSKDGKSFSVLGEVKGSGNSTSRRNYSFTDNAPAGGTNYYRLRQVDYDGTESYSNVVALEVAGGSLEASVYPTVASRVVTISLPDAAGNITINVVDATGRPVATITNINERKIELPVHSLKSGMYFVRVTNGQSQQVKRFIKE